MSDKRARVNFFIVTLTIFAGYTIFGLSENVKGPAIPRMQADFAMSESVLGLLLAINAFGYLVACGYTAPLARRIGLKTTLLICLAIMALSGLAISYSNSVPVLGISFFVLYLGNGMLEIALGITAALLFTKNPGKMLNISHFFYGVGSIIGPILSAKLMLARFGGEELGWRSMYVIALALALVPFLFGLFGRVQAREHNHEKAQFRNYLKDPVAWYVIWILAFGAICEMGLGAWLVNYLEKAHNFAPERAAFYLTAFFAAFTLARIALGPFTDKIGLVRSILITCAFSAVTVIAGVLMGAHGAPLIVLSGLGISMVYPTVMAVVAKHYTAVIDTAMTVTMTVMGIISMAANLLLGAIIDFSKLFFAGAADGGVSGAYSTGIMFLGVCCIAATLCTWLLYRRFSRAGITV